MTSTYCSSLPALRSHPLNTKQQLPSVCITRRQSKFFPRAYSTRCEEPGAGGSGRSGRNGRDSAVPPGNTGPCRDALTSSNALLLLEEPFSWLCVDLPLVSQPRGDFPVQLTGQAKWPTPPRMNLLVTPNSFLSYASFHLFGKADSRLLANFALYYVVWVIMLTHNVSILEEKRNY